MLPFIWGRATFLALQHRLICARIIAGISDSASAWLWSLRNPVLNGFATLELVILLVFSPKINQVDISRFMLVQELCNRWIPSALGWLTLRKLTPKGP